MREMCERCDAWEKVIFHWFGGLLLAKLEAYVEETVEKRSPAGDYLQFTHLDYQRTS
jgi:hypothetical protein